MSVMIVAYYFVSLDTSKSIVWYILFYFLKNLEISPQSMYKLALTLGGNFNQTKLYVS